MKMGGEEKAQQVRIDPKSVHEPLRTYLEPIKNEDPQLEFYAMYRRETTEYDCWSMKKYDEDLNTTLIFAGLFSAVSSAFVIDVHSKLEPNSRDRSEAYLRAILLSLNRSVAPDEDPATVAPPVWGGPPAEIITASDLLYASLLISLLAAFVAMLGKQWVNRYLLHVGGSSIERCADRQRKCDGLEKWPFRFFIGVLPIMLQIALLLLACGLSRYMWLVNTFVARVIISFTVLGVLLFIGFVIAGTSSPECPFQTPASMGLRRLGNSEAIRKLLASLSPSDVTISFVHAIWMNVRQGLVSVSRRAYDVMRYPLPRETSPFRILSSVGDQVIILLLQIDRAFGNAKQRVAQEFRRLKRSALSALLPTTVQDIQRQLTVPRNGLGLQLPIRNLEALRKRNTDDARCLCWALRKIPDPKVIESAMPLAGTIRWFDSDSNSDPPFDLIVSAFEECFDSTKQLYLGMRDRAYFSARAILQISTGARIRSPESASKYPIPPVSSSSSEDIDPDLRHILCLLERNRNSRRPVLDFPKGNTTTHAHSLWMSNLFVDLTRAGLNPTLRSYQSYLSAAVTNHRAVIANILLVWCMLLGGHVEEETFWVVDKSDSLETILCQLTTRVIDVITDGTCLRHLNFLLEFLAAWKAQPSFLAPMAYQWCSAISKMAGRLGPTRKLASSRFRPRDLASGDLDFSFLIAEDGFSRVGPDCDRFRLDDPSHRTLQCTRDPTANDYADLLLVTLKIVFRPYEPWNNQPTLHLEHVSHHGWMFETAFSSDDDEAIADAVCVWILHGDRTLLGSCVGYFAKRMERDATFSPRLRQLSIRAIECIRRSGLEVSDLETVHLLNRLKVSVHDRVRKHQWARMLVDVIRSPTGLESLSPHYWRLLNKLVVTDKPGPPFASRDLEVMRSLEKAREWEKLRIWMVVVWSFLLPGSSIPSSKSMADIERVTFESLLRRPESALPESEDLCEAGILSLENHQEYKDKLQRICARARVERFPPE